MIRDILDILLINLELILSQNKTDVAVYIPRGLWYDYYTVQSFFSIGEYYVLPAPIDTIPLLIRGGSILPAQIPSVTTTESRKNNFELLIALDENENANGELYWDDGDSIGKKIILLHCAKLSRCMFYKIFL